MNEQTQIEEVAAQMEPALAQMEPVAPARVPLGELDDGQQVRGRLRGARAASCAASATASPG